MIIFSKMKQALGGNVRLMVTGSAPLAADVLDFLRIAFSSELIEAYGMTETAGGCITYGGDPNSGHVGGPVANLKVKLRDIPEMNYLHTNNPPKGEICIWGPTCTKGYFKNPEKTAETIVNGWIMTGDVGRVNANLSLSVIDRAKNIFKLSQGEYIAPEKIENILV